MPKTEERIKIVKSNGPHAYIEQFSDTVCALAVQFSLSLLTNNLQIFMESQKKEKNIGQEKKSIKQCNSILN